MSPPMSSLSTMSLEGCPRFRKSVLVSMSSRFCTVMVLSVVSGANIAVLFGFPEIVATFALANQTYIILSFLPCVFSPEKIDDCPAYGGF